MVWRADGSGSASPLAGARSRDCEQTTKAPPTVPGRGRRASLAHRPVLEERGETLRDLGHIDQRLCGLKHKGFGRVLIKGLGKTPVVDGEEHGGGPPRGALVAVDECVVAGE